MKATKETKQVTEVTVVISEREARNLAALLEVLPIQLVRNNLSSAGLRGYCLEDFKLLVHTLEKAINE